MTLSLLILERCHYFTILYFPQFDSVKCQKIIGQSFNGINMKTDSILRVICFFFHEKSLLSVSIRKTY